MATEKYTKTPTPITKCFYNPDVDVSDVVQGDIVNVNEAFLNGSIPDNVSIPDVEYDGNEEPESIYGKPSNAFDVVHMQETQKELSKSKEPE